MRVAEMVLSACAALLLAVVQFNTRRRKKKGRRPGDALEPSFETDAKPSVAAQPSYAFVNNVLQRPEIVQLLQGKTQKEINVYIRSKLLSQFPKHYERFGHVVVVKPLVGPPALAESSMTTKFLVEFADSISRVPHYRVDVVVLEEGGVVGELRIPSMRILWSRAGTTTDKISAPMKIVDSVVQKMTAAAPNNNKEDDAAAARVELFRSFAVRPTFTVHVENGVRYAFDPLRVMFASGNTTERMHFGSSIDASGEVVVDMFAGIGYFSLPLAMRARPSKIFAIEKNAESAGFLAFNCVLNDVQGIISVVEGDNRRVAAAQTLPPCDRVIMGYINTQISTKEFLPAAYSLLRHSASDSTTSVHRRGIIHYHFLSDEKSSAAAAAAARAHVVLMLGDDVAGRMTILQARTVKSFAPRKWHQVADLCWGE